MKINIKYELSTIGKDEDNILMEKKTIYNRKLPKHASLVIKLNQFDSYDNLVNLHNEKGKYYFEIDLFAEDRKLKKVISDQLEFSEKV
jgi:hypothetical protein